MGLGDFLLLAVYLVQSVVVPSSKFGERGVARENFIRRVKKVGKIMCV